MLSSIGIFAIAAAGAAAGLTAGAWVGDREGGDYNFAPAIYGPVGATIGGAIGLVVALIILN